MQTDDVPDLVSDPARLAALDELAILDTPAEEGFDDVVHMASRFCDTPVALVSLVAADRQWFKARVGFPPCETDLNRSVCAHALDAPDLLVIEDLTLDPRTSGNPLVTGDPFIRFYAGAPLRLPTGDVVGSLCVIDQKPRPGGLTADQADMLRRLARQVVALFDLRRSLADRDEAIVRERREQERAVADAARLEAMIATQQAVAAAVADLDVIFQAVVDGALAVISGATGAVVEMRDGEDLVYRTVSGTSAPHEGTRVPIRGTLSGRALLAERPLASDDTESEPDIDRDLTRRLGIRSMVVTPVSRRGAVVGVLKVQSSAPHAFSPRDIRMAQMLAGLVASAFGDVGEARTRRALREAESRYKSIFDSAVDFAIVAADPDGVITDWNEGAVQIMGWSEEEMRGTDVAAIFTPEDRAEGIHDREMDRAAASGSASDERWHLRKDGTRFWALGRMMALRYDDGTLRGYLKILQDRTIQKQSQEKLKESEARFAAGEAYWRGLFEHLSEGFIVGEVIRSPAGDIVDWRYIDVNGAWGDLVGIDPATAIGRTIREVFPCIEDAWVDEFADVVRTGVGMTFTRQVGTLSRWYEGRAFQLTPDRFGALFLEVTDRVRAERRQAALLELGLMLRDAHETTEVTRLVCRIVGEAIGGIRVGFGVLTDDGTHIDVEPDWTTSGALSLAGRHRFDDYGQLRVEIQAGALLVISDVTTDPRTVSDPSRFLNIGVRSLVNVPVRERGRTVALFYVHDAGVRDWTADDLAFLQTVADRVQVALARMKAEDHQAVLNQELSHRLKNTLAMVQAIATQTLRNVSEQDAVDAFKQRLMALSQAHDLLLQQSWAAAPMRAVVEAALSLHGDAKRFEIEGPSIKLGPKAVLSVTLLLHELATNAVKYGSLSVPDGTVRLTWRVIGDAESEVVMTWTERGGPAVTEPSRRGFGTRLIHMGLTGTGKASLRYEPTGLHAEFRAPQHAVSDP